MGRWLARALAGPALLVVLVPASPWAADAPPGASSCSGCHGAPGSPSAIPSLADKPVPALAGIMREFKSGARPATVMGRIARGFSDSEIDAIAEWIAGQR